MANGKEEIPGISGLTHQNTRDITHLREGAARLEFGMESLQKEQHDTRIELRTGLSSIAEQIRENNAPEEVKSPVAGYLLILASVVAMGSTLAFVFNIITNNMQRESDQRYEQLTATMNILGVGQDRYVDETEKSFENVAKIFADDDLREREDAFRFGQLTEKVNNDSRNFMHLDEMIHIKDAYQTTLNMKFSGDIERNYIISLANNDNLREHRAKQGSSGHPVAQREINNTLGVQQQ